MKCLNVGCNYAPNPTIKDAKDNTEHEWVRIDINPDCKPDIVCDITQPLPAELVGQFDVVYASHVIEHISWRRVNEVVRNICDALKPNGRLIVLVPDMEWACAEVLRGRDDIVTVGSIFGGQETDWDTHRIGFTEGSLLTSLTRCGLQVLDINHTVFQILQRDLAYDAIQLVAQAMKSSEVGRAASTGGE